MRRLPSTLGLSLLCLLIAVPLLVQQPEKAEAAASMYLSTSVSVAIGQNVNINLNVNTGGQSANAFDATFTYPTSLFEGVRGTYSGSICTLPITDATPSGGTASISCGKPSGFTGTGVVATIVLKALADGTANLGLSGCTVLANDGLGTDISGGCSGTSILISGLPTPVPTPTPNPTHTPTPKPTHTPAGTPKPTATAKPSTTPTPGGPAAGVDTASTPPPTPPISGPDASKLPESTATPEGAASTAPQTEKRSIAQAVRDIFSSIKELKSAGGNLSGIVALLLSMIPVLILAFLIVFFGYRLYILERRRRLPLDRLFELELGELASLEGKLDLLAEKGTKGREQFRDEFKAVKENILRQIKPNYNKPVDAPKDKPAAAPPEEKK